MLNISEIFAEFGGYCYISQSQRGQPGSSFLLLSEANEDNPGEELKVKEMTLCCKASLEQPGFIYFQILHSPVSIVIFEESYSKNIGLIFLIHWHNRFFSD
jgi:hypothetical protein